jgi:hypothetical protein
MGLRLAIPRGRQELAGFAPHGWPGQKGVSSEWPLVKGSIVAGASFPVAVAMGDFYEAAAGLVE